MLIYIYIYIYTAYVYIYTAYIYIHKHICMYIYIHLGGREQRERQARLAARGRVSSRRGRGYHRDGVFSEVRGHLRPGSVPRARGSQKARV